MIDKRRCVAALVAIVLLLVLVSLCLVHMGTRQEHFFAFFNYGIDPMRLEPPYMVLSVDGKLARIESLPESAQDQMWYVYTTNDSSYNDGIIGRFDPNAEELFLAEGVHTLCGFYFASTNPNLERTAPASIGDSAIARLLALHEQTMPEYIRRHEHFPLGPDGSVIQTHQCQMDRDFVHLISCRRRSAIFAVIASSGTTRPIEGGAATGLDVSHIYALPSKNASWRLVSEGRYALLFDLDADGTDELITLQEGEMGGALLFLKLDKGQIDTLAGRATE